MPYYVYHDHIQAGVGNNILHFRFIYTILYDLSLDMYLHMGESGIRWSWQLSIAYPHSANENLIILMEIFECTASI